VAEHTLYVENGPAPPHIRGGKGMRKACSVLAGGSDPSRLQSSFTSLRTTRRPKRVSFLLASRSASGFRPYSVMKRKDSFSTRTRTGPLAASALSRGGSVVGVIAVHNSYGKEFLHSSASSASVTKYATNTNFSIGSI